MHELLCVNMMRETASSVAHGMHTLVLCFARVHVQGQLAGLHGQRVGGAALQGRWTEHPALSAVLCSPA